MIYNHIIYNINGCRYVCIYIHIYIIIYIYGTTVASNYLLNWQLRILKKNNMIGSLKSLNIYL